MNIEMVMCRSCGTFVEVKERSEEIVLRVDECPECGGREFTDNETGDVIQAGR